jgi:bifunctional enzyme CysN/CysC
MTWYEGPTLMHLLDNVEIDETRVRELPLRLPVQWVNRPNHEFRGFAGTLVGGKIARATAIRVQPSGRTSRSRASSPSTAI